EGIGLMTLLTALFSKQRNLAAAFVLFFVAGCALPQRSAESGYKESAFSDRSYSRGANPDRATEQTAYELGKDPKNLNAGDFDDIRARQKVRELERQLGSKKEREQYSKVLPWLSDDQEKVEFLSIPSIEGRQQWINSRNIWSRARAPEEEMKNLIDTQDIAKGMPQDYVRKSWGDPMSVEVSGNPLYKNERWKYQKYVSTPEGYRKETRFVYFEAGRVVGWETEF
ncbi:MAG: hypothetical protein AAGB31_10590, partial [Bdellovibrio sp.]